MKGDFTRDTFDKSKHFSRVLMQQGRVQLDADWNEQVSILWDYMRTLAMDIIGPHAGPTHCCGFRIMLPNDLTPAEQQRLTERDVLPLEPGDFLIGAGRYYVDGILCENNEVTTYLSQGDLPGVDPLVKPRTYLVYLDVWERHITSIEDDYIREKALGGPDTATRAKVVWQLRVTDRSPMKATLLFPANTELPPALTCDNVDQVWHNWTEQWQPPNRGYMRARIEQTEVSKDPCNIPPDSKYRGAENQLYRVEIHRGGRAWDNVGENDDSTRATFKWSRDNGAIASPLTSVEGDNLIVQSARGFSANGWVEVSDDERELRSQQGSLVKLIKVEDDGLTIDPDSNSGGADLSAMTKVRRWDQRETGDVRLMNGVVPIEEGVWIPLEDGIEVYFAESRDATVPNVYRAGDYWLIPARVATGQIEWPTEEVKDAQGKVTLVARAVKPRGIIHHYAQLGVVRYTDAGFTIRDCRCEFSPINNCGAYPDDCGQFGIGFVNMEH